MKIYRESTTKINYVKHKKSYSDWKKISRIYKILNPILKKDQEIFNQFLVKLDFDVTESLNLLETPLTHIEIPNVYIVQIHYEDMIIDPKLKKLLNGAYEIIMTLKGLYTTSILIHDRNTWIPPHVHEPDRPPFDDSPRYNIYLPILVGSTEIDKNGANIGENCYQLIEGVPLIFNYQIPHDSWNFTDQYCIGLIIEINKEYFTDIPYENYHAQPLGPLARNYSRDR